MTPGVTPGVTRSLTLSRRTRLALAGIGCLIVAGSPFWGPLLLRRIAFFHVRRVEVLGAHYVSPSDILRRLRVDTTVSLWDSTEPFRRRVAGHPEIEHVEIRRKFPGTLVVELTERVPVALVPANGGFRVYDARGIPLPIDPAVVGGAAGGGGAGGGGVDAPVLMQRDTGVLRLLAAMRERMPAMYARVSAVRRVGEDELVFQFPTLPVRTMQDVTLERLAELEPVEADLRHKQARVSEIDLRYRDQVIARLQ